MIHTTTREEFLDFAYTSTPAFLESIAALDVYVVKRFYDPEAILGVRRFATDFAQAVPASWHPCLDGVPDYHRINDEYEGSWVRARMRAFFFHRFNENRGIFDAFKPVLELKNHLRGADPDADYESLPSSGVISRIVCQQYPAGGGYLSEHIDPTSPFALIQTIVQASRPGSDFSAGGLYMRASKESEPFFLDGYSDIGDLIVLTPHVRHGVAPIDPAKRLDWNACDGRWMVMPIVIRSDYNMDPSTKPRQVAQSTSAGS